MKLKYILYHKNDIIYSYAEDCSEMIEEWLKNGSLDSVETIKKEIKVGKVKLKDALKGKYGNFMLGAAEAILQSKQLAYIPSNLGNMYIKITECQLK